MTSKELQVVTREISQLKPWRGNPRKHSDDVDALVRSIERFGWTNPILIQRGTLRVIAGHGRLQAAKDAGLTSVPTIELDLDDQDADAYTVADNRLGELSEWDTDALTNILDSLTDAGYDISSPVSIAGSRSYG